MIVGQGPPGLDKFHTYNKSKDVKPSGFTIITGLTARFENNILLAKIR